MVQPQPKASVVSMAPVTVKFCVREVISAEDNAEYGNGEATLFTKENHQPFPLRKRLTVRRDTIPVISATARAIRTTTA